MTLDYATQEKALQAVWDFTAAANPHDSATTDDYRTLDSPSALLVHLTEKFFPESLVYAGVAVEDEDEQVSLVEPLATPGALLAVRDQSGQIIDVVGETDAVARTSPSLALLRDIKTQLALDHMAGVLFVAFSLSDVDWLRSAGLPATLCPGAEALTPGLLMHLNREVLRALAKLRPRRRLVAPCEPFGAGTLPPTILTIVNWSPANPSLAEVDGLRGQLTMLAQVEALPGAKFPEVCVWSPQAAEITVFGALQSFGLYSGLCSAVWASVAQARHLSTYLPEEPLPSYAEAQARYWSLMADAGLGESEQEILASRRDLDSAVERDMVRPLLERAEACHDPVERVKYVTFAEYCRQHFQFAPAASQELAAGKGSPQQSRQLLESAKTLMKIAKQLE